MSAFPFPVASGPLVRPVDLLARWLMRPPAGYDMDFTEPAGEPALVAPNSVSWVIFKNPVTLFVGGAAAVLLELAEPRVRDGVWDHSDFRRRPLMRLKRTGMAAMVTVYAARSRAEATIARVVRMHERVKGRTREGARYEASDPELLDWVQATAGYGFMEAYDRCVRPLSAQERERLFAEAMPIARLYGATGAPASQAGLDELFAGRRPTLAPSPVIDEFLALMTRMPALPAPVRPLQKVLLKAAVGILPEWACPALAIGDEWQASEWEMRLVRAAAQACDRLVLPSSPAVGACRRLGLPDDYLYRRRRPQAEGGVSRASGRPS